MSLNRLPVALALCLALVSLRVQAADDTLLVFAAASLREALDEASSGFVASDGRRVAISYAGTPALARQIEAGAPARLLISADQAWMDHLQAQGHVVAGTRIDLLANRLVLIAPKPGAHNLALTPAAISAVLGERGRLAIAEPSSVPAGRYAKASMISLGLWTEVQTRLAPTDNVRAALRLVALGESPLGVVYATDAVADDTVDVVAELPADSHPPIRYPAALIGPAVDPEARRLLLHLQAAAARAVFERHGFEVTAP